ncbi:MAG: hypothetical protein ANABAC_1360 [Anaerolineae bacterium]|nr:MAG: hypothetical protein ANABAC_1360 [Anaerolineae bacterium]
MVDKIMKYYDLIWQYSFFGKGLEAEPQRLELPGFKRDGFPSAPDRELWL